MADQISLGMKLSVWMCATWRTGPSSSTCRSFGRRFPRSRADQGPTNLEANDFDGSVDGFEPTAVAGEPTTVSKSGPALRHQQKRALTIFAATFAGVAIVVAAALFAASRGGGVAASAALPGAKTGAVASSGHPAATSTLAPGRTPEDLAVSMHIPAKLRIPLRRWNNGNGGKALAAVSNEMGIALQAGGTKLYVSMKAACTSLTVAITAADAAPPIPDAALQNSIHGRTGPVGCCRQGVPRGYFREGRRGRDCSYLRKPGRLPPSGTPVLGRGQRPLQCDLRAGACLRQLTELPRKRKPAD